MKNIYTFITSTISFVSVIFIVSAFIDGSKNEFSNYPEMKKSGVYRGHWLPAYIPQTATNIKEKHYYDTNYVIATFQYDPNEILEVKNQCIGTPMEDGAVKFFCPPFIGVTKTLLLYSNGNGHYESRKIWQDEKTKNL